ncbi:hypothetical protein [Mycobacterium sp. NAZ190054]|nr:hypothetical protein [Mycobacterium sp. NAZ190054]
MIRGRDEYALAGELAWLTEWLEVAGPRRAYSTTSLRSARW